LNFKKIGITSLIVVPLLLFGMWYHNHNRLVPLRLSSKSKGSLTVFIPENDRQNLEYFFRTLMLRDDGIYTLIDFKPMSFAAYTEPSTDFNLSYIYHTLLPRNLRMYWGWQAWLKYRHLFPHPKFELWAEQSPWNDRLVAIIFADIEKVNTCIQTHSRDFKTISNLEGFRHDYPTPFLKTGLKNHEGLIGTLLGYGRNNAWLFQQRAIGEDTSLTSFWDVTEEGSALEKIYGWKSLISSDSKTIASELFIPLFLVDPCSEETELLRNSYRNARISILKIYEGKDFLETTLSLLMED
jgi:hypothetical protein